MYRITVRGTVQGVGFRPFVHRLALEMGVRGYVKNRGDGVVEIAIDSSLEEFLSRLRSERPPVSSIDDVIVEEVDMEVPDSFHIAESGGKKGEISLPPPDVAICDECLKELFDPEDRRYMYPFISCTHCGPRYSVSLKLPFDRENTTFMKFPLCDNCRSEYEDLEDRRYYAQSIACSACGPAYRLLIDGSEYTGITAIKKTAKHIDHGNIVAVKGWGGFHIACLTEDEVVSELREILHRPQQPFAIMARDVNAVRKIAILGPDEVEEMLSSRRPIVVLKKRKPGSFIGIAPSLDTIGVMLPYSPLHHILFSHLRADYIVMTSANRPGEPMYTDDSVRDLIPTVLTHDLPVNRVDDSVVKFVGGKRMIIRRSRGFVPAWIKINSEVESVSFGAELYSSIGFLKNGRAVMSQYIGDISNFRTFNEFYRRTLVFLRNYIGISEPELLVCDMHPLYNSTTLAEKVSREEGIRLVKLQHHVAHALSVMGEYGMERSVAVTVDGAGYGVDGSIWGCEILLIDLDDFVFQRLARMEHIHLPGGDLAVRYPGRALVSILMNFMNVEEIESVVDIDPFLIEKQIRSNLNVAVASSAGRYMDSASALLGICGERTYEGEPAMKLEAFARDTGIRFEMEVERSDELKKFGYRERSGKVKVMKITPVFESALELLKRRRSRKGIAYAFIECLARTMGNLAVEFSEEYDAEIVLSGGVAYNRYFTSILEEITGCLTNRLVPSGDNGISFGQLYVSGFLEECQ